tara:strand:- start:407 stop:1015 length:609 start_codon:yes stop_codon:yes gene_type:complete
MKNYNLINISKGSGKMENIHSINTNTLTNNYCIKQSKNKNSICNKCYSMKMLNTMRKNCIPNFQQNSELLSKSIIHVDLLPNVLNAFFRFSSHGELINNNHLINLINICLKNKHCIFTLWTKRTDIINKVFKEKIKPKNLILIFSNSKLNNPIKSPPKYFDKTFNNVSKDFDKTKVNCFGKCQDCLVCYKHNNINQIVEYIK